MTRLWRPYLWILVVAVMVPACAGQAPAGQPESVNREPKPTMAEAEPPSIPGAAGVNRPAVDQDQAARAKPAKATFPEIEFRPIIWMGGTPVRQSGSGVWVYTKEQHPPSVTSIKWEENDLVLIQLPLDTYKGYEVSVRGIQDLGEDIIRIVCQLEPPWPNIASDLERLPTEWIVVPAGALVEKRFIITDQDLQELPTD